MVADRQPQRLRARRPSVGRSAEHVVELHARPPRGVRRHPGQLGPAGDQPRHGPGRLKSPISSRGAGIDRAQRASARSCATFQPGTNDRCAVTTVSGPAGPSTTAASASARLVAAHASARGCRAPAAASRTAPGRTGVPATTAPAAATPARRRTPGRSAQRPVVTVPTASRHAPGVPSTRRHEPAPPGAQRLGHERRSGRRRADAVLRAVDLLQRRRRRRPAPPRRRAGRLVRRWPSVRDRPLSRLKVATRTGPTLADRRPAPTAAGRRVRRMSAPTTPTRPPPSAPPSTPAPTTLRRASLVEWLRIPSISGDPAHRRRRTPVRRVAGRRRCATPGSRPSRSGRPPGCPPVFAEWPSDDPDAPTVARLRPPRRAAGHAARPVGAPAVRADASTATGCYARGAADDKGQVFFHTLGVRAHLAATGRTSPGRQPQAARRGRGGVRLAELRRPAARARRPARLRRRRRLRHRHVVARDTDRRAPACAA